MARSRNSWRTVLLAVCLTTPTSAYSIPSIFERATTCGGDSSLSSCSSGPTGFCCPSGDVCNVLADNTTVLCCPTGTSCATIETIPCDIQLQNATAFPANPLKTTALTTSLPTCGSKCCPFGYSCNASGNCVVDADQSLPPSSIATTVTSSSAATAAPKTILSATSAASTTSGAVASSAPSTTITASSSNTTPAAGVLTSTCSKFPAGAVLAGFFPGIVLGALLAFAVIFFLGRKSRSRPKSGSSFGNTIISDPRPIDNDMRTDFLRYKAPMTPSTATNSPPSRRNTVKGTVANIFRKSLGTPRTPPLVNPAVAWSPGLAPPMPLSINKDRPKMTANPMTPPNQRARTPHFEDIPLGLDNGARKGRAPVGDGGRVGGLQVKRDVSPRGSHMTTWPDMMEKGGDGSEGDLAGMQKGQRELTTSSSSASRDRGSSGHLSGRQFVGQNLRTSYGLAPASSGLDTDQYRFANMPSPFRKSEVEVMDRYWQDERDVLEAFDSGADTSRRVHEMNFL